MSYNMNRTNAAAPRSWRRSAGDKTRMRRWLDEVASDPSISRGCKAWALTLSKRSSATAKPVWGYQEGQAAELGCSARQVRRYRIELERARLIETQRGEVVRHGDGRYSQQMTNRYCFLVPPRHTRQNPCSDRADTGDRLNPIPSGWVETSARNLIAKEDEGPPAKAWGFDRNLIGAARSVLRAQ